MKLIHYLLIYSLLFTSLPTMGQSDENQDNLDEVEENRGKVRARSDIEKGAEGTELDIFSKCQWKWTAVEKKRIKI